MLCRLGRMREGDVDAFQTATDEVIVEVYLFLFERVWGKCPEIDRRVASGVCARLRKSKTLNGTDLYEHVLAVMKTDEWGRDNRDGWTSSTVFVVFSAKSYERTSSGR